MALGNYITGAVIQGGNLIISLSDGRIIDCGYCQGSVGERGRIGPIGPSGKDGTDGLSMRTGTGFPDSSIGVDGEVFYSVTLIAIFVKSGGTWGAPVYLMPQGIKASTGQEYDKKTAGGSGGKGRIMVGGGPMPTAPQQQQSGLHPITGNGKPLAAATPLMIAADPKGLVFRVELFGQAATGSAFEEIVATRDGNGNTGHSIGNEVLLGTTPPNLTFTTAINAGKLELTMKSDIALSDLRGKIIWL